MIREMLLGLLWAMVAAVGVVGSLVLGTLLALAMAQWSPLG